MHDLELNVITSEICSQVWDFYHFLSSTIVGNRSHISAYFTLIAISKATYMGSMDTGNECIDKCISK
jgi:hypothetical protein